MQPPHQPEIPHAASSGLAQFLLISFVICPLIAGALNACHSADESYEYRREERQRAMAVAEEARCRELDLRMQPAYLKLACQRLLVFEFRMVASVIGVPAGAFIASGRGAYGPSSPGSAQLKAGTAAAKTDGNWEEALELMTQAAEMGNPRACELIALYTVQQRDYSKAAVKDLLTRACEANDPVGFLLTAQMILSGEVESNGTRADSMALDAIERGGVIDGCELLEAICKSGTSDIDWTRLDGVFKRLSTAFGSAQSPPALIAGVLLRSPIEGQRATAKNWLEAKVEMWRTRYYVAPFALALGRWLIESRNYEFERGRLLLELAARGKSKEAADLLVETYLGFKGLKPEPKSAYTWCLIRQGMGEGNPYNCTRIREGLTLAERAQAQIDANAFRATELP